MGEIAFKALLFCMLSWFVFATVYARTNKNFWGKIADVIGYIALVIVFAVGLFIVFFM